MKTSPLQPTHRAAGARLAPRPEAPGVEAPLTFGDVPEEYAAATTGCALFDETDRNGVSVRGTEAVAFLHRLLANDVRTLSPGRGNRNLLLTPKGKVLFDFDLLRREDDLVLSAPPSSAEALVQALDTYLFTEDVSFEVTTDEHAPLELCGPQAASVLEHALDEEPLELADHETRRVSEGRIAVTRKHVAGVPGWRVDPGPSGLEELWGRLVDAGARPAGLVVRDIVRVEAGAALFGVDVDENVYPQEARLEEAFDLEKGCYVGQEVVAKIDTYGGLNKLLMVLRVDHDDPVPRGVRLLHEEKGEARDLGLVTSWAYSFALDTGLVLAYVKRRHQAPGTVFDLDDGSGTATILERPVLQSTGAKSSGVPS